MCAVKFAYIGAGLDDLRIHNIEEKSYSPVANIEKMTSETFKNAKTLKDIAIVCTLNNNSSIVFEDGKFNKQGEPTEAALRVFAEKLGQFDSTFNKPSDYSKSPTAYSKYLES